MEVRLKIMLISARFAKKTCPTHAILFSECLIFKIFYSKEFPVAVMFINGSEENEQSLWRTVLIRFGALGKSVSGEKIV
jgi:hypothetical protein